MRVASQVYTFCLRCEKCAFAARYADIVSAYEGTRLGRQEIYGELLEDVPGALWSHARIDESRRSAAPGDFVRVVVAVDRRSAPASTQTRPASASWRGARTSMATKETANLQGKLLEAAIGVEPMMEVLQSSGGRAGGWSADMEHICQAVVVGPPR